MSRPSNHTHSIEQTHPASDCDYRLRRVSAERAGYRRERFRSRTAHARAETRTGEPQSSGFEWGYGGSGPAQLALALLLDYTDDEAVALDHYQEFKTEVVSQLDCAGSAGRWRLTGAGSTQSFAKHPASRPHRPSKY